MVSKMALVALLAVAIVGTAAADTYFKVREQTRRRVCIPHLLRASVGSAV